MVFHFHIRAIAPRSWTSPRGETTTADYPEIVSAAVYHGQRVFQNHDIGGGYGDPRTNYPADPELESRPTTFPLNGNNWRVDFRELGRNAANYRTSILDCSRDGLAGSDYGLQGALYPGYPGNLGSNPLCNRRTVGFFRVLRERGEL